MTQAFNLSQLANKVNTSGQLDASTGLYNQTPVANGGTGKSSVTSGALLVGAGTSAMTEITGTTPSTTVVSSPTGWTSAPIASVAGGDYIMRTYTTPQSWTKPATIKAIKVTVIGAGGNGGPITASPGPLSTRAAGGGGAGGAAIRYFDAPAIPGPVNVAAGPGTNSFGPWDPASPAPTVTMSATAGSNGATASPTLNQTVGGDGGIGSNGTININGGSGFTGVNTGDVRQSTGGSSILGGNVQTARTTTGVSNGTAGSNYGGGGGGAIVWTNASGATGGTGAPGVVIIEEFY